jgi:ADP-ribose pyrophosphatase
MNSATLESRRRIFEGRVFRVEVDRVVMPNGRRVDMDVVRHPGSVVLLPTPSDREIVLIRQYRYAVDRWLWELPAGTLKEGEDPAAAAARECEEEIGLVPGRIERLRSFYPTPGFCDEEMIFFRCAELRAPGAQSPVAKDADEDIEPRVFTLEEARALLRNGEIADLKTAVGLALLTR